jgi:hypothetical protein
MKHNRKDTNEANERPMAWHYPGDRARSLKHRAWSRAKSQAAYREEEWGIEESYWMTELWPDTLWPRRGRGSTALGMTRRDPEKPWQPDNVFIVTRRGHVAWANTEGSAELAETEPGVWDITGETLVKYLHQQQWKKAR